MSIRLWVLLFLLVLFAAGCASAVTETPPGQPATGTTSAPATVVTAENQSLPLLTPTVAPAVPELSGATAAPPSPTVAATGTPVSPAITLAAPGAPAGTNLVGVFDGRTPCGETVLGFTGHPPADCQRIKWRVTLYQDPATGAPTTYEFKGTQSSHSGRWTMVRGTPANPEAVVYQLVPNGSGAPLSLLQVDENVLLFLDENLKPLIGDLYSSYTLSRKDAESKGTGAAREGAAFGLREMPPQTGLDTPGVFEGNTPCGNGAGVVPITPPNAHCEQMVWKLTLNYDGARSTSTTYRLEGAYGMAKQGTRELVDGGTPFVVEGKWMIGQNADTKSEAVIYQLNPDVPEATISFLRINDNLLLLMDRAGELMVGNGGWGYTLKRTE